MAILDPQALNQGLFASGLIPNQQKPMSELDKLQALINQQNQNLAKRQAAATQMASTASQRVSSQIVNEEQEGLMDALRNPSEAQNDAFIAFGLGLAGSTGDISQRIAQALGSGVSALRSSRQDVKNQEIARQQANLAQLQLQQEGLSNQFTQTKDITALQRQQDQLDFRKQQAKDELDFRKQQAKNKIAPTSPLLKLVNERNTLMAQGTPESIAAANILEQQINVLTTSELSKDDFKFFSDDFKGIRESARKTDNMLRSADRAELALANAETGFGSETILGLKKFANLFGVKAFKSDISDSEALQQVLGENVLDVLGSGDLGAGTGLSDKDVEFARQVAGGTIRLDEETIRYAIDAKRRAANFFRKQHNDALGVAAESFSGTTLAKGKPYDLVEFTPISEQGRVLAGMPEGSYKQSQKVPSRIATPYKGQSDDEFLKTLQGF